MMRSVVLSTGLQKQIKTAIDEFGEASVSESLDVSPVVLLRAAVGRPISRGTRALIHQGLQKIDEHTAAVQGLGRRGRRQRDSEDEEDE
jgi:hypothetical protein